MPGRLTILITSIALRFDRHGDRRRSRSRGAESAGLADHCSRHRVGGGLTAGLRLGALRWTANQVGCTPDIIHRQHNVTTVMALAHSGRPRCSPATISTPKDRARCCRASGDTSPWTTAARAWLRMAHRRRQSRSPECADLDQYRQRGALPRRAKRGAVLGRSDTCVVRGGGTRGSLDEARLRSGRGGGRLPARRCDVI
jgi:hypothetical protein